MREKTQVVGRWLTEEVQDFGYEEDLRGGLSLREQQGASENFSNK